MAPGEGHWHVSSPEPHKLRALDVSPKTKRERQRGTLKPVQTPKMAPQQWRYSGL
jgi:hypothetical protein